MKVGELIERLQKLDQNMAVVVSDGSTYGVDELLSSKKIRYAKGDFNDGVVLEDEVMEAVYSNRTKVDALLIY